MPDTTVARNPGWENIAVYPGPGGASAIVYEPTLFVTALYRAPVVVLDNTTWTPATTAPVVSVTMPVMDATSCPLAHTASDASSNTPATENNIRIGNLREGILRRCETMMFT